MNTTESQPHSFRIRRKSRYPCLDNGGSSGSG